jgi:hypothetical protein
LEPQHSVDATCRQVERKPSSFLAPRWRVGAWYDACGLYTRNPSAHDRRVEKARSLPVALIVMDSLDL